MTSRGSQHHTHAEPQQQAAVSLDSFSLQGTRKKENISKDKPKPPPRNSDFSSIPKPKSNIRQQQEFLPSGVTGTQTFLSSESEGIKSNVVHRESQTLFDGLATQSKCTDYPQKRYHTQTAALASNNKPCEQMHSERNAALQLTHKMSFRTAPPESRSTVSPNIQTRRRRFDLSDETKVDSTFLSGFNLRRPGEENNTRRVTGSSSPTQTGGSHHVTSQQRHRIWSKAPSQAAMMDAQSTVSQAECFSKDYSCRSRDIDQRAKASQPVHTGLKTCLVAPQTQEASRPWPAPAESAKSKKHPSDHEEPSGQNKNHKEVNLSDMWLNQTDMLAPPDHHSVLSKLLEHPSGKCVVSWPPSAARCPFNSTSSGSGSKGVSDLPSQPQSRVYQGPEETTPAAAHQVDYSHANRAFIMEEAEDPYYVTMYYPGSVYVGEYTHIQSTLTQQSQQTHRSTHMTGTLSSLGLLICLE